MSIEAIVKNTLTCFLCGGVHIYPGPRFGSHLLNEHGIVFNHEYIVAVAKYKDEYSSLPPIKLTSSKSRHDQFSQTDRVSQNSCTQCARQPIHQPVHQVLASTPVNIRKLDFHAPHSATSQPMSQAPHSPSSFFSAPRTNSLQLGQSINKLEQAVNESPSTGRESDSGLPARSGFICQCALCPKVYNDFSAFWGHITKRHGLSFKKYKERYGSCQTPVTTGKFQCLLCQLCMKHMPGSVDKHLRLRHGINWYNYLDLVKKEKMVEGEEMKKVKSGELSSNEEVLKDDKTMSAEPSLKKSRPLNVKDKTNKYCSYCEVPFNTRRMFLKHCQDIHNLRFKNKSGQSVVLNKPRADSLGKYFMTGSSNGVREDGLPEPDSTKNSGPNNDRWMSHLLSQLQSPSSPPDMAVSSSKKKRVGEGVIPCQYCLKMFSSSSNMERHVRLACTMRVASNTRDSPSEHLTSDTEAFESKDCEGFKCDKCGRVFAKLGNMNRHSLYSACTELSQFNTPGRIGGVKIEPAQAGLNDDDL